MAYAVDSRVLNPANQLRDSLEKAERLVITLSPGNVEQFLLLLDQIEHELELLEAGGMDSRPERSRWESILSRISRNPSALVSAAEQVGGLDRLRAAHPPAESFWWRLDQEVTRRRRSLISRSLATLFILVAGVWFLLWAVDTFFPPNPEAVMMVDATGRIDRMLMEGNLEGALAVVEEALQQMPNEPELRIWQAVLLEQLNEPEEAAAILEETAAGMPDQAGAFWTLVGNKRLQLGDFDGAQVAAQRVLQVNPDDPQGYFLIGGIAESRGDFGTAIEMFNLVFELAEADNPQLAVIARVRMGQLLQQQGAMPFDTQPAATATPEP
jgi:tetratricopeptide (TPR) repeat protein